MRSITRNDACSCGRRGLWARRNRPGGDGAAARAHRFPLRRGLVGADGDGVFAGRPALRRAAERAVARHQERRAPPDAVPHADRRIHPANADCSASRLIPTSPAISSCTSIYTATTPAVHNRISRFKANGDVEDTAVSEVVLLDFDNLSARPTTTAARFTSGRTESCTPRTARMPRRQRADLDQPARQDHPHEPCAGSGRSDPDGQSVLR